MNAKAKQLSAAYIAEKEKKKETEKGKREKEAGAIGSSGNSRKGFDNNNNNNNNNNYNNKPSKSQNHAHAIAGQSSSVGNTANTGSTGNTGNTGNAKDTAISNASNSPPPSLVIGTWVVSHLLRAAATLGRTDVAIRVFSLLANRDNSSSVRASGNSNNSSQLQLSDLDCNLLLACFLRSDAMFAIATHGNSLEGNPVGNISQEQTDTMRALVIRLVTQRQPPLQLHSYVRSLAQSAGIVNGPHTQTYEALLSLPTADNDDLSVRSPHVLEQNHSFYIVNTGSGNSDSSNSDGSQGVFSPFQDSSNANTRSASSGADSAEVVMLDVNGDRVRSDVLPRFQMADQLLLEARIMDTLSWLSEGK